MTGTDKPAGNKKKREYKMGGQKLNNKLKLLNHKDVYLWVKLFACYFIS
jgi:hypothetical protein